MESEANVCCNFKKPMHVAVQNGDIEEIEALAKSGVKINQVENGQTPLHLAIIIGETLAARKLISLGANLSTCNKDGFTPLHVAVLSDHMSVTDLLIDRDFYGDIDTFDENGNTALHIAVWLGKVNTVRTLFIKGADADRPNKKGHTSLHIAIIQENSDVLDVVLEYVRKPNILDKKDFRPLHIAVLHNRIDAIRKIGQLEGIKVNYLNGNGNSALHLATKLENLEAVYELSVLGADMNLKNSKGYPPIHLAVLYNKLRVIETLVQCGAQIDSADRHWNSPVHLAATQNNIDALTLLNHLDADIELRNAHGNTPLHSAVMADSTRAVRDLIDYGASLNIPNANGMTPLHLASYMSNNENILLTLIQFGTSNPLPDAAGNDPLHIAAKFCNSTAIETLIYKGVAFNLMNKDNLTALDITMQYVRKNAYNTAAEKVTDLYKKYNLIRKYPVSTLEILKSAKTMLRLQILRNFEYTPLHDPEYSSNTIPILQNYINDCIAEVKIMRSTMLPIFSFHDYLILDLLGAFALPDACKPKLQIHKLIQAEYILNHMLDISTNKGYPIYHKYVFRRLYRPSLLNKVQCLRIHTRYNGRIIFLDLDVMSLIIKHLGNEDIFNLLLAYSDSDLGISDMESSNINKRKIPELKLSTSCMDEKSAQIDKMTQLSLIQKSTKKIKYSSVSFSERISSPIITRSKKALRSDTPIEKKVLVPNIKSLKNSVKTNKKKCISMAAKSTKTKKALSSAKIIKGNHSPLSTKVSKKNYSSSVKTTKEKCSASTSRTRKEKSYSLNSKPSRKKLSSNNLKSKKRNIE